MYIREKLQEEYSEKYINGQRKGIYLISVRFGKTRLGIKIMQKLEAKRVLICYPNVDIKNSWENEFEKMEWKPDVIYSTYLSLKNNIDEYDLVILDEIHLASENQRIYIKEISNINENILGLTGTLADSTKVDLFLDCELKVIEEYLTDDGIGDEIIADYKINIVRYKMDDDKKYLKKTKKKQWMTTDKKQLGYITRRINGLLYSGGDVKFLALTRMRFINNNKSLQRETLKLIKKLENQRLILFGGTQEFIDSLEIPTYHSKSKQNNLELFQKGTINKLGLCKLANQGVTFDGLTDVVITNIDSNSENLLQKLGRSLVKEGDKISNIWIIVSDEEFQLKWLSKALTGVNNDKIKWI